MYSGLRGVGEAVKAINKNLLTCGRCRRTRVVREGARICIVNWGERWKSGEECERKWGRGEGKGG